MRRHLPRTHARLRFFSQPCCCCFSCCCFSYYYYYYYYYHHHHNNLYYYYYLAGGEQVEGAQGRQPATERVAGDNHPGARIVPQSLFQRDAHALAWGGACAATSVGPSVCAPHAECRAGVSGGGEEWHESSDALVDAGSRSVERHTEVGRRRDHFRPICLEGGEWDLVFVFLRFRRRQ